MNGLIIGASLLLLGAPSTDTVYGGSLDASIGRGGAGIYGHLNIEADERWTQQVGGQVGVRGPWTVRGGGLRDTMEVQVWAPTVGVGYARPGRVIVWTAAVDFAPGDNQRVLARAGIGF